MHHKNRFTTAALFLLAGLCLSFGLTSTRAFAGQALLSENDGMYPRIVALSHNADASKNGAIIASVTSFTGGGHEDIFVSHDQGLSFTLAGQVTDSNFSKGLCCGGLYELPGAIATDDGATFWHTPTLAWAPVAGSATGQLVLQGQILVKNGVPITGNGKTILLNAAGDGTGPWVAFDAATDITLSDASVTLSAITDTTVQVTVKPTTLAATNSRVLFAGLFGMAFLGLIGIRRKDGRFHPLLALLAVPLILTGCGGGGGSSGGGGGTTPTPVSTTYTGILTATSVTDPTVTTSAPFTVTITKTS